MQKGTFVIEDWFGPYLLRLAIEEWPACNRAPFRAHHH
jgi:hypothetical protein